MMSSRHRSELQYHLHFTMEIEGAAWDLAVNVGTNDSNDRDKRPFEEPGAKNIGHRVVP